MNREDGKIIWQKSVNEALPHEGAHYTASLASASPVTDGERVFAHFGSYGLCCLDFAGNVLWKKRFGTMQSKHGHGEGSSPALYGKTLIVNWDHEGDSFVVALNTESGDEIWRVPRQEVTSWSSPIIVKHEDQVQVIIAGTNRVRAYDIASGKVIWECGGLSANVVATPVAAAGMVFVGSSYEKRAMFAIDLSGARGDITGTDKVVWHRRQRTPYVPSPLLVGDSLYFLRHYQGILTRLIAKTGAEPTGPFRMDGLRDIYASPVAADGRIYVTDRDGMTAVFSQDAVPRVLSMNRIADRVNASLALAGGELFIRGEKQLYCIAEE